MWILFRVPVGFNYTDRRDAGTGGSDGSSVCICRAAISLLFLSLTRFCHGFVRSRGETARGQVDFPLHKRTSRVWLFVCLYKIP